MTLQKMLHVIHPRSEAPEFQTSYFAPGLCTENTSKVETRYINLARKHEPFEIVSCLDEGFQGYSNRVSVAGRYKVSPRHAREADGNVKDSNTA